MENLIKNKKKFLYILILFLFLFFSGCSSDEKNLEETILVSEEEKTRIVAFGDSLTAGLGLNQSDAYPAQLEEYLLDRGYNVKVYNSGLSGETSSAALSRVEWVLQLEPEIVILVIGANDAFRGIDLDLTKNNIAQIVEELLENDVRVVLGGVEMVENLGEEYVAEFEAIYSKVAQEKNVTFIEKFLEGVGGVNEFNQADRIHPTKDGYRLIVENNVGPIIQEILDEKK